MWYGSDFGGNDTTVGGGGGGGGFLNNTTVDSPTKKGAVRRLQNVVPVVIRQLKSCQEEEFKLFETKAQILNIVGVLRDYEVQSTKATYNIEDHTGSIKAVWWLENDSESTPNLPAVKEGSYVQVFGSLRNQEAGKIVMVLRMFLVEDANIVTNHLLQVIHARLGIEAMNKSSALQIKANNPGAALANSMSFMDENMAQNGQSGLTTMQQKVYQILQANDTTTAGTSRQNVLKHFTPNQHREVSAALDFLINEGHAYSTIDNDHFKVTDIM
ncbi:hypothetical protein NQ315_012351 [Exocentrus adspersus]|uniref:Replication protein A C-terminal domain-containing protein n=1 Tax=Exocentrus adspersus TaxID=1586481 RepID=A0AAV8V8N2_9CUCU|nr:hypothetical protein NQ315_012351 [Exocentrus adspersus]